MNGQRDLFRAPEILGLTTEIDTAITSLIETVENQRRWIKVRNAMIDGVSAIDLFVMQMTRRGSVDAFTYVDNTLRLSKSVTWAGRTAKNTAVAVVTSPAVLARRLRQAA